MYDPTGNRIMHNRAIALPQAEKIKRIAVFVALNVIFSLVFFRDLYDLMVTSLHNDYSYIPFVPFVSFYLLYQNRKSIFHRQSYSPLAGIAVVTGSALLLIAGQDWIYDLDHNDSLALTTFGLVWIWIGIFTLCHGIDSLKQAAFPLLFLLFAVPLPNAARETVILLFQRGSTEAAYAILKMAGIPFIRDGFIFHLPALSVEVAEECSGIRSGLSLIITGVLAASLFLNKTWTRTILIASIIPITMLKNGIRIATLTILGAYWNQSILDGDLHKKGGVLFFVLALVLLGSVIVLLKKYEKRALATPEPSSDIRQW